MPQFDRLGNDMSDDIADALAWEEEAGDMSDDVLCGGDDYIDPYQEAMEDELGAAMGDPRRCPRHPHVVTSSPDGMFDAPCDVCEGEMEEEYHSRERIPDQWQKSQALGTDVACDASSTIPAHTVWHCVLAAWQPDCATEDDIPF